MVDLGRGAFLYILHLRLTMRGKYTEPLCFSVCFSPDAQYPFIHPILEVSYLASHEKIVMVQPRSDAGSLKDLIYEVPHPTLEWSQKYAKRQSGLPPDVVARYGRQVLEVSAGCV